MNNTLSFSLNTFLRDCHFNYRLAIFFIIISFASAVPLQSHAQISGATSVCVGANMTLSDTGTGTWSSSNPGVATIGSLSGIVNGLTPGTTTITYTTGSGPFTTTVTVNSLPSAYTVSGGGSICAGSSGLHIELSGSTSGIHYQLFNGATGGTILGGTGSVLDFGPQAAAGTYTVVATNPGTTCSATMSGSAIIVVNPAALPICGPTAGCAGSTWASCYPGGSSGTWASSSPAIAIIGSTTGIVTGVTIGTSTITYTLPTGCYSTETVTVTSAPCALSSLPAVCGGTTATLTDCVPGGVWTSSSTSTATIGSLSGFISGLSSGITTITYSLGTGCTVTGTLTVTASPAAISGPSSACTGSTITLSDVTPGGAWASSATGTATVSTGGVVTGIGTGSTTISYTAGGCTATTIVTVNASPSAIGGPSSVCASDSIAETDILTGGAWSIIPATTASVNPSTGIVTGVGPGTATVTYSINGCVATKIITVNATAPITGTLGMCIGAANTLSNTVAGGTWSSSNTAVATVIAGTGAVTGVSAGNSVITYTTPAGCAVTTTVTVSLSPGPISGPSSFCNGACVTLSGSTGGGVWSVSPLTAASIGSASGIVCGAAPGTASVTYSLGGGCAVSATITVNTAPSAISGTTICAGSMTTLTDTAAGGIWASGTPSVATISAGPGVATGISSGTAIISYTLSSGCKAFFGLIVNALSPITGPASVCAGQTIPLSDSVYGGSWSSSATATATVNSGGIVTGVTAGTATISYITPGGCIATTVVTVNPVPLAVSGPHSLCAGSTITLTDLSAGGTWSSGNISIATISATGSVTGVTAGRDTISYTFTGGCAATFTVTVNPLPAAIGGPSVLCLGGAITLTDASPGGSWHSSLSTVATIGASTGLVNGIATGPAGITYTLPTSCLITTTVSVITAPAAIAGTESLCAGGTTLLTDLTTGGSWSSGNTAVATVDAVTGAVSGLSPGTSTITYSTGAGCSVTAIVTVNPLPSTISGSTLVCQGSSVTLTDPTPSGTWSSGNPGIATINAATGSVTGVATGLAAITYTLGTGCSISTAVFVDPPPATITGFAATCLGLTTSLSDATTGGAWSSSNPAIASIGTSGIVTGFSAGTAIISYIAPTGCVATIVVTINPFPTSVSGSTSVCVGVTTTFTDGVTGGAWTSSDPTIATASLSSGVITGITAGTVTIVYTLGAGCTASKDITVNPLPPAISGAVSVCAGSSIMESDASPGGAWSSGSPAIATIGSTGIVTGISSGTTIISYTLGCSATQIVTANPMPSAITGSFNTCTGGTTTLLDSVSTGVWSSSTPAVATIGSVSGVVTGITTGTDTIEYTLPGGCFTSAFVNVYPPPSPFAVTGGGNYCTGGVGVHIGLAGSSVGVIYLLYRGATATGTFPGTGSSLDFGLQTIIGAYTVVGTSTLTGCSLLMYDTAVVGITPVVIPSVNIIASPGDTVCSGTPVTYTPVPVNGGTTPAYQWFVDGVGVSSSSSYSYIPVSGDIVMVQLASSAACAIPDTVSKSDTMLVNVTATPTITITATPGDTVCRDAIVTLSSSISFGGTAPVYTWMKNGAAVSSASLYSFIPSNNDVIYCILQSNYPCRSGNADTSSQIVITVDTPSTPVITISASPSAITNPGDTVTLTASVTNGGPSPTYQWDMNGAPITGATNATYTIDTFSDPQLDSFTCRVTGSAPCLITATQSIYIIVAPAGVRQLTATGSEISVQPNPNKGEFTITGALSTNQDEELNLEITDMLGKVVYNNKAIAYSGRLNEHIQLSKVLANGMYLLTIHSGIEHKVFHIVIEQ